MTHQLQPSAGLNADVSLAPSHCSVLSGHEPHSCDLDSRGATTARLHENIAMASALIELFEGEVWSDRRRLCCGLEAMAQDRNRLKHPKPRPRKRFSLSLFSFT
jgi:hypothetical protein